MKSTLEMHLVAGIQPVLIADVLFESVAVLWERNAVYINDSIAREFWEGRTKTNTIFVSNMYIKPMYFISFSSRLSYLYIQIVFIYQLLLFFLGYFINTSLLHGITR